MHKRVVHNHEAPLNITQNRCSIHLCWCLCLGFELSSFCEYCGISCDGSLMACIVVLLLLPVRATHPTTTKTTNSHSHIDSNYGAAIWWRSHKLYSSSSSIAYIIANTEYNDLGWKPPKTPQQATHFVVVSARVVLAWRLQSSVSIYMHKRERVYWLGDNKMRRIL